MTCESEGVVYAGMVQQFMVQRPQASMVRRDDDRAKIYGQLLRGGNLVPPIARNGPAPSDVQRVVERTNGSKGRRGPKR